MAFKDVYGNKGISYRGTDMKDPVDWIDNALTMLTGSSPQAELADNFFERNKNLDGCNYLYGHSKGGEMSSTIFVNHYKEIKQCHTLNGQPINPIELTDKQISALNCIKYDPVINESEFVWMLGGCVYKSRIRFMTSNTQDVFISHGYEAGVYDECENIIQSKNTFVSTIIGKTVGGVCYILQLSTDAFDTLCVKNTKLLDYLRNRCFEKLAGIIRDIENILKTVKGIKDDIIKEIVDFYNRFVDNAKEYYSKNFNRGYHYAITYPVVIVNTDRLYYYAKRLSLINTRLNYLNHKIDKLYWQIGLLDLWNLMQSDLKIGHSYKLLQCQNYLVQTVDDFEKAENKIMNRR